MYPVYTLVWTVIYRMHEKRITHVITLVKYGMLKTDSAINTDFMGVYLFSRNQKELQCSGN